MAEETAWINEEFLTLALSNNKRDDSIIITDYSIKPAVESGNNYCTRLHRVRVNYQKGSEHLSKSLIVKAPLEEGSFAKSIIDEVELLKNEHVMYTRILPEINAISKKTFSPKTYFCEKEDVLVMDDLTEDGFKVGDRLQQLDLAHCRRFITTLAEYHGTTVALHRQDPALVESNGTHPFYSEKMKNERLLYFEKIKFSVFVKIVQNLNGLEKFVDTIQSFGYDLRTIVNETFKRRGKVNVLNHGDCWTNNIMFKYTDEGEISDCRLIDFQVRSYGSPVSDLLYFLFTSARGDVRKAHMDGLLQLYCETLNKTLQELDCEERIPLVDLREEMQKYSPVALHSVINFMPMILHEPDELSEELKNNEENLKSLDINVNPALRIYLSKTYNNALPGACDDLIKLGIIEYFKNLESCSLA